MEDIQRTGRFRAVSRRAHSEYAGGTDEQRRLRSILRAALEAEGFTVYPPEWWHFDYKDWREYPILNISFSEIGQGRGAPGAGGN